MSTLYEVFNSYHPAIKAAIVAGVVLCAPILIPLAILLLPFVFSGFVSWKAVGKYLPTSIILPPTGLSVENLVLRIESLPQNLSGIRIAHLSDFHCTVPGTQTSERYLSVSFLKNALAEVVRSKPHVLVLSGDFVQNEPEAVSVLITCLQEAGLLAVKKAIKVPAKGDLAAEGDVPINGKRSPRRFSPPRHSRKFSSGADVEEEYPWIIAVWGNHDLRRSYSKSYISSAFKKVGIHILENEALLLRCDPYGRLELIRIVHPSPSCNGATNGSSESIVKSVSYGNFTRTVNLLKAYDGYQSLNNNSDDIGLDAVNHDNDGLQFVGLGELWDTKHFKPHEILPKLDPRIPTVVVCHQPDAAKALRRWRVDLQLSGHTHGGQIRLPIVGPLLKYIHAAAVILPKSLQRLVYLMVPGVFTVQNWNWSQGLIKIARTTPEGKPTGEHNLLYVNRGLATHPPLRLFCPPELTVYHFQSADDPRLD